MTKAKLVIFRHGETEYNKQNLMTGRADVPLTETGKAQAREAGGLIKDIKFDKVYSSTLSRAFNTAALALEASATQVHLLNADGTWQIEQRPEIIELDAGEFTGRNHKTDPEILAWQRAYAKPLPGGESEEQGVARVREFFEKEVLPRLERGENVLVVVHAGIVRMFDIVLGLDDAPAGGDVMKRRPIPNAAPTVYTNENGVMTGAYFLENPKKPVPANENIPAQDVKKKQGPKL